MLYFVTFHNLFLNAENLCCKSIDNPENQTREHELIKYAVCECFKVCDDKKHIFLNVYLLEVQALLVLKFPTR